MKGGAAVLNLDGVNPGYPIPDWLYVGQEVYTACRGKVIKGVVTVAFGDAAQVENENEGFSQIVSRYHLRVKKGS